MFKKIKAVAAYLSKKFVKFCRWYKNLYKGKAWYTKTGIGFCSCIVAFFLYLGMVDINFLWLFGSSPGYLTGILDPQVSEASEIYSADGKLIGKYFNENRTPVKYEEVAPSFFKALVDTEDERFYKHMGIDPIGLFGAVKDAATHHGARGASTITQQLAKNMFRVRKNYSTGLLGKIPGLKILIMKSKEWIIAVKLESVYTKKEIITMYANTVDFGSNSYGIKTAAKTYFNTTPADLKTEQAAVLVGMLKATTYYNPKSNPENSMKRRNVVLNNMVTHGDLSRAVCDSLSQLPITLDFSLEENYDGQAKYFREAIAKDKDIKQFLQDNGYDLYTSGLKIYTTIDTRMQKYAEAAVTKQMKQVQRNFNSHWSGQDPWRDENGNVIPGFIEGILQKQPGYQQLLARFPNNPDSVEYYVNRPHKVKLFDYEKGTIEKEMSMADSVRYMVKFMHCAFVAMEPQTGAVKAWVGDIDFDTWKYDKVTADRQPGSTFKLFVYTEAMNQGLTPCDKRRDEYIRMEVYDKVKHENTFWTPSNANGRFSGDSIPLKSAFAKSINSIAVRLGQEMGIKNIINTAHQMGITNELEDAPSLTLGSSDVKLLDMVDAYCCVANNGKHVTPVLVTRIVDKDGKEVYKASADEEQAIPYKSAFFMQQLLIGGMREPGGTSQSLWAYTDTARDTDFGGKTGTTNNHSDAWFMCVSPKLVCGAWVGGEYRCIHFRTGALGQGSRTALPVCGYFVQSVMGDPAFKEYHAKFDKPHDADISYGMYNCASYTPARRDTAAIDSTQVVGDMEDVVELDENGNEIVREPSSATHPAGHNAAAATEQKPQTEAAPKHQKPKNQQMSLDDF